jgi:hypothetical protein
VDAATVAGYYGSDSAGTFVTCVGVLSAAGITYAAYMPVMLAVMEIPGCLVALFLVSRLREKGLDAHGNAWDEAGYDPLATAAAHDATHGHGHTHEHRASHARQTTTAIRRAPAGGSSLGHDSSNLATAVTELKGPAYENSGGEDNGNGEYDSGVIREAEMSLQIVEGEPVMTGNVEKGKSIFSKELLHEVFLNPGIYLLFGGIAIGFISRMQGEGVVQPDDELFVNLFHGVLCLFLLEMGITASRRLRDLKTAGWPFIAFGLLAPNIFASLGMLVAHLYAHAIGAHFDTGTYVLFAVLCGAASYIAVPAVQRLAIPEASPTLPLAASLGLTFSYNVTLGIPVYILIAQLIMRAWPVADTVATIVQ